MYNPRFEKETFKKEVKHNVKTLYRKTIEEATPQQLFQAVSYAVKEVIIDDWIATQNQFKKDDPKTVYYMSMEFLMGRALGNNLINMTAYKEVKAALDEMGIDLNVIEDEEPDPALGNGGLGRLAACFLDSLATLGYAAYGCGIRYRYGMFKQKIENGYQVETPDNWLKEGNPFELRREEYAKEVRFGGNIRVEYDDSTNRTKFVQENYESVLAIPYDMPIVGYGNHHVNTLRIWDAKAITDFQLDSFDRGDYHKAVEQENLAKTIVEVLYPNDNHYAGKELRLKQQYFFISASIQAAITKYKKTHDDIHKLPEKVIFQMNDTHPTVAVAELMRILLDEEELGWNEAWDITTKTCAYTNHTIMAEALEKWPIDLFSRLLPRVYQIIQEIDRRYQPERVLLEYNGMWPIQILRDLKLPKTWGLYQAIDVIDGSTFEMYRSNMQSMVIDMVTEADMVLFNRCTPDMPLSGWKRSIRAVNRMCEIVFEDEKGEELEVEDILPYSLEADTIVLEDEDYGIWYLDIQEHPERYTDADEDVGEVEDCKVDEQRVARKGGDAGVGGVPRAGGAHRQNLPPGLPGGLQEVRKRPGLAAQRTDAVGSRQGKNRHEDTGCTLHGDTLLF